MLFKDVSWSCLCNSDRCITSHLSITQYYVTSTGFFAFGCTDLFIEIQIGRSIHTYTNIHTYIYIYSRVCIHTEGESTFPSCYIFEELSCKCQYFENLGIFCISLVTRYSSYLIFSIPLLLEVLERQCYMP